jgi:UrcA family protein
MKTFTTLAAAVALTLSVLPGAQAANPIDVPTTVVRFGDLDLNKAAGVTALYDRIQGAAHAVCAGLEPSLRDALSIRANMKADYASCMEQAIDRAVTQINVPSLTAFVASKGRTSQG